MSALVQRINSGCQPCPVKRSELMSLTQRSLLLSDARAELLNALDELDEMKRQLETEKQGLRIRLANGAELEND